MPGALPNRRQRQTTQRKRQDHWRARVAKTPPAPALEHASPCIACRCPGARRRRYYDAKTSSAEDCASRISDFISLLQQPDKHGAADDGSVTDVTTCGLDRPDAHTGCIEVKFSA